MAAAAGQWRRPSPAAAWHARSTRPPAAPAAAGGCGPPSAPLAAGGRAGRDAGRPLAPRCRAFFARYARCSVAKRLPFEEALFVAWRSPHTRKTPNATLSFLLYPLTIIATPIFAMFAMTTSLTLLEFIALRSSTPRHSPRSSQVLLQSLRRRRWSTSSARGRPLSTGSSSRRTTATTRPAAASPTARLLVRLLARVLAGVPVHVPVPRVVLRVVLLELGQEDDVQEPPLAVLQRRRPRFPRAGGRTVPALGASRSVC